VIRPQVDETERRATVPSFDFAAALVSSGEEGLFMTLKRCIAADDVDVMMSGSSTGSSNPSVRGKERMFDAATVARCKEAIEIRENLNEMGVFDLASTVAQYNRNDEENSVTRILRGK